MNDDLINRLLAAIGDRPMTYRQRLDKRFPEMHEEIERSALQMIDVTSSDMSNNEIAEHIRNDNMIVVDGIYGLLNGIEIISEGKVSSRDRGAAPVNLVAAFVQYLWSNPEVTEGFRKSDIFNELIESSYDGFEWPNEFGDDEVTTPGNYM
jgi:hypothetical protein